MKYAIIVFPGSNCDRDTHYAVKHVMRAEADYIWYEDRLSESYDCIIIPGGFSYGDYLRAGAIARFAPVMEDVTAFANSGKPVIGICNGFQILLEAGLLPGAMLQNRSIHFICKPVFIKCLSTNSPFTNTLTVGDILNIPVAHMDGNYYCDESTYQALESNNQILFKYSDSQGNVSDEANPNGSLGNIAGICNEQRNVFGLMPHPERAVEDILGSTDGTKIFQSIQSHHQALTA